MNARGGEGRGRVTSDVDAALVHGVEEDLDACHLRALLWGGHHARVVALDSSREQRVGSSTQRAG